MFLLTKGNDMKARAILSKNGKKESLLINGYVQIKSFDTGKWNYIVYTISELLGERFESKHKNINTANEAAKKGADQYKWYQEKSINGQKRYADFLVLKIER